LQAPRSLRAAAFFSLALGDVAAALTFSPITENAQEWLQHRCLVDGLGTRNCPQQTGQTLVLSASVDFLGKVESFFWEYAAVYARAAMWRNVTPSSCVGPS
jgi:hypothetical protein